MAVPSAWINIIGLAAAGLIVAVGAFVLAAKPGSDLHRFFFALAMLDGASTGLFQLSFLTNDPVSRTAFVATYFHFFIAFLGLLAIFGVSFPKPPISRARHRATVGAVAAVTLLVEIIYVFDHSLFWTVSGGTAPEIRIGPAGNLLSICFVGVVALLVLRVAYALKRETSESHRRQAAYVMGGMALAYLPYPWTVTMQDLAARGLMPWTEGRWDRVLAHWVSLGACIAMIAVIVVLSRRLRQEAHDERAFVFACFGGVGAIALIALLLPDPAVGALLRTIALLAYPALLGFAIARYEVFDIDRRIRRAATVSLAAAALAAAFFVAEEMASNLLASQVAGGLGGSELASTVVATLATAGVFVPIARVSRKLAARVVPELGEDQMQVRKLEIYRHSLAGALADGILQEGESRTLAALRQSLGISDADHARLVMEVGA